MPPEPTGAKGTRRLMLSAAVLGLALFAGLTIWAVYPGRKLPTPDTSAMSPGQPDLTEGRGAPAQRGAESAAGKSDPGALEDPSGGRSRSVKESSRPLSLNDEQKKALAAAIHNDQPQRHGQVPFELMIGAAVPQQIELRDLPAEAAQAMQGYWGSQYTVVGDTLVVVDLHSRRVVALVPQV